MCHINIQKDMLSLANELTTKMVLNCTLNDVVAHYRRCGGSLEEMWWLIKGDVVDHKM